MTWRLPTCFRPSRSAVRSRGPTIAGLLLIAISLHGATVSGVVELRNSRLDAVNRHKDYSGVVISLQPVGRPAAGPPTKHTVMLQKNKMFTPHVLPILAGTVVDFPNADPIFHNAFSRYNGQVFDVGLYPPGTSRSVRFTRPGIVRVFCNIHPSMSSVILVLTTPWFATTSSKGTFDLDVPDGVYDLNVFHERATEQTLQMLSRRVIVAGQTVRLVEPIVVSEAGALIAPHKNKYGVDYGAPPDDRTVYPGVRN
ncbi:MAG: hypothetical protein M3N54_03835 [Acidobacteriota bacterium]|nr:hypothetical protein [Acidobacteriota bacterium]